MSVEVNSLARPEITRFRAYREAMKAFYNYKKSTRASFSYRKFSKVVGLKSPNYLQLVITGQRRLSVELAGPVAKALGMSAGEGVYFSGLVRLENAASAKEQENANQEILVALKKILAKEIPDSQIQVLNRWYYLAVRELVLTQDFRPDGEWISQRLRGLISPTEAEDSLALLQRAKLIRCTTDGRWTVSDPILDTGDLRVEARILGCHIEILKTWVQLLPSLAKEERELGLLNIPIPKDKIPELRRRVRAFQDEIIGWIQDVPGSDSLVQLGTYVIPLTRS